MAVKKTGGINSSHGALAGNTTASVAPAVTELNSNKNNNSGKTNTGAIKTTQATSNAATTPTANTTSTVVNASYESSPYESDYDYESKLQGYIDMINQQYAAKEAAQKAAVQAAVDQSVNSLNAQKTTTAQDYADTYRQLYLNNMNSQKNIGQQMAAQGVTGGASESTLLGLNTNYEDNLRQGKVAEQNALSTLDQAITNAQLSGSIEAANNSATTASERANAYLTAYQQELAAQQTAAQLAATENANNRSYSYQMAMAMLQSGSMPSDALLNSAGISKTDAQTIVANYVSSKTGSGSSSAKKATTTDGTMKYGQFGDNKSDYDAYNTAKANVESLVAQGDKATALSALTQLYSNGKIDWNMYRSLKTIYKLQEG